MTTQQLSTFASFFPPLCPIWVKGDDDLFLVRDRKVQQFKALVVGCTNGLPLWTKQGPFDIASEDHSPQWDKFHLMQYERQFKLTLRHIRCGCHFDTGQFAVSRINHLRESLEENKHFLNIENLSDTLKRSAGY